MITGEKKRPCEQQKEKEILSVKSRCVHRYKGAEGATLVGEHYER